MRGATRISILLAFVLAGGCRPDGKPLGEGVGLRAVITPDSAGLGDRVVLKIEAVLPKGARPRLPGDTDSLGGWRKLEAGEVVKSASGANERWTREVTVAAYRLGAVGPESLRVRAVDARGESLRMSCPAPRLTIGGSIASRRAGRSIAGARHPRGRVDRHAALAMVRGRSPPSGRLRIPRRQTPGPPSPSSSRRDPGDRRPDPGGGVRAGDRVAPRLGHPGAGTLQGVLLRGFRRGSSLPRKGARPPAARVDLDGGDGPDRGRLSTANERAALRDWLAEGDLVKYARMERLQAEAKNYLERSRDLVRQLARGTTASPEPPASGGAA